MDRGSTEVEIHCACAWERYWGFGEWAFSQIAYCRAHMEAEIAKQGQAAGAVGHRDSQSPASPANQSVAQQRASQ